MQPSRQFPIGHVMNASCPADTDWMLGIKIIHELDAFNIINVYELDKIECNELKSSMNPKLSNCIQIIRQLRAISATAPQGGGSKGAPPRREVHAAESGRSKSEIRV